MALPKVPTHGLPDPVRGYLVELVRKLEIELKHRPSRQSDGAVYFHPGQVVRFISPNGTVYELTVDNAGALVTTEVTP